MSLHLKNPQRAGILVFLLFCFGDLARAGNDLITINQATVPSELTVCQDTGTFSIQIENPTPFQITNLELEANLPEGIEYIPGSIQQGNESDISDPSDPLFSLANMDSLTTRTITFRAKVGCDIISYIDGGQPIQNNYTFNYHGNGSNRTTTHTTGFYDILEPNISIVNITNRTINVSIGDNITRCITIRNAGNGSLRYFQLNNDHGSGLTITNVDKGNWTTNGTTEEVILGPADFSGIGNGDGFFDNGEEITICEDVSVDDCDDVLSEYDAFWGCGGQKCQNSVSTANMTFPGQKPSIQVQTERFMQPCTGPGTTHLQRVTLINTGTASALNLDLDIFQPSHRESAWNPGSFIMRSNGGADSSFTPDSTETGAIACMANGHQGAYIDPFSLPAGDTLVIEWEETVCFPSSCGGNRRVSPWRLRGTYENLCGENFSFNRWNGGGRIQHTMSDDNPNVTLTDGETQDFQFLIDALDNSLTTGTNPHWRIDLQLPSCVNYSGNFEAQNPDGSTVSPDSITTQGSTVSAYFSGQEPFDLNAHLSATLGATCGGGCGGGLRTLEMRSHFVQDQSCSEDILANCVTAPIDIDCPTDSCQGLTFEVFSLLRDNYGQPDNDNDGLPDPPPATLDMNNVRQDRAMTGDTLSSVFAGHVQSSTNTPGWDYWYAELDLDNALGAVGYLDGQVEVYPGGTGPAYTCPIPTSRVDTVNTGNSTQFTFDLSFPDLIADGCVPAGYSPSDGDSLVFKPRYIVGGNIGSRLADNFVTGNYYLADNRNPSDPDSIHGCNDRYNSFDLLGYDYIMRNQERSDLRSCDSVRVENRFYAYIGNSHAGGNLFQYEYRNFSRIDTIRITPPAGFRFSSATYRHVRTAGSGNRNGSAWIGITPVDPNADTLEFSTGDLFTDQGGTLEPSDEGYLGRMETYLIPSCNVPTDTLLGVDYNYEFAEPPQLQNDTTPNSITRTDYDELNYHGVDWNIQSPLQSITADERIAEWEVQVNNFTDSEAKNVWIAPKNTNTSITIQEVEDLDKGQLITPQNGIYRLDSIPANGLREVAIRGSFTSCDKDSIVIMASWSCQGYPDSLAANTCETKEITLYETPRPPDLKADINGPDSTLGLCDTAQYIVEGRNIQTGYAYQIRLSTILPEGIDIVPGSSELLYPEDSTFRPISDPVQTGQTRFEYNVSAIDSLIGVRGLPGILKEDENSFKIRFQVNTSCEYTSGSIIRFLLTGRSNCGEKTGEELNRSLPLEITNATPPYETFIHLDNSFISPCSKFSAMDVAFVNQGPASSSTSDSLRLLLPPGVSYIPGSFADLKNATMTPTPVMDSLNDQQELKWGFPAGLNNGDTVRFRIRYDGKPDRLQCGTIYPFYAQTTTQKSLQCVATGNNCTINVATGDTIDNAFTYKGYFDLLSASGTATPTPPTESVQYDLTFENTGQTIDSGHATVIGFYYDVDTNGRQTAADEFLTTDTIFDRIGQNTQYAHSGTIDVEPGKSCQLLAVLDTSRNKCNCRPTAIPLPVEYQHSAPNQATCSDIPLTLGPDSLAGYTYQWDPSTDLNNDTVANPVFTHTTSGPDPDTALFTLDADRVNCTATDSIQVITYPNPATTTTPDTAICREDSVQLNATGGSTYAWSPSGSLSDTTVASPLAFPMDTTAYEVVVTDTNGCKDRDTVQVNVRPLPVADAGPDTALCLNDSIQLQGSSGTTFAWSPATSLNDSTLADPWASPTDTTDYTLLVTDANGCQDRDTMKLTVDPLPPANAGMDTSLCPEDSIQLQASGGQSYAWQPATGLIDPAIADPWADPADTTTHTVTVTDSNGCAESDSVTLNPYPAPVAQAAPDTSICYEDTFQLRGSGGTQYAWSPAGSLNDPTLANPTAYPLSDTQYQLVVTSAEGCQDTTTVDITVHPLPPVTATPDTSICPGATVQLQGSGAENYWWSPALGLSDSTVANPTVALTMDDTTVRYELTGQGPQGCYNYDTATVTVHPEVNISLSTLDATCHGSCDGEISMNTQGGTGVISNWTITWLDSTGQKIGQGLSAKGLCAGRYEVIAQDAVGCSAMQDTVIHQPKDLIIDNVTVKPETCYGDCSGRIKIDDPAAVSYDITWGDGERQTSTDSVFSNLCRDAYTVGITDTIGCRAETTVGVNSPPEVMAQFNAEPEETTIREPEVMFSNHSREGTSYLWRFGDGDTTDAISPAHTYPDSTDGKYNTCLIVTNDSGCVDTACQEIWIKDYFTVFVPNAFTPDGDGVNDGFAPVVRGHDPDHYRFTIYNRWGEKLFESTTPGEEWDGKTVKGRNGDSKVDVYVWELRVRELYTGEQHRFTGHVMVVE